MMPRMPRGQRNVKPPYGTPINRMDPLARGLVADYLCNEGHGRTLHDGVNGMDLIWQNSTDVTWIGTKTDLKSQGSEPTAYIAMGGPDMPGTGDTDQFSNADAAPFRAFAQLNVSKAVSMELWMWMESRPVTFPNPVSLGTTNTDGCILSCNTAPTFTFRVGAVGADANDANAHPSDPQQRWQQFVGVFDERASVFPGVAAGLPVIYRDGLFRGSGATRTWTNPTSAMRIGNTSFNGNRCDMVLGLVRVWDRALNPDEVAELYSDPFRIYGVPRLGSVNIPGFEAKIIINLGLDGALTTAIQMGAAMTVNLNMAGSLTTAIQMIAQIAIELNIPNPELFAAKVARRLQSCGHPMFTKCERTHLGDDI